MGAVDFSRRMLERLIAIRANVVGVCTLESSTLNADHADLSGLCETHGLPWIYAPDINSPASAAWIADRQPDVVFCFGWSRLLAQELLNLAPLGVIGYHPAALPENRGRHPLIWALALGLTETASTFFFMNDGADSGDILSQTKFAIDASDDAGSLYEKVVHHAIRQMEMFVPRLASGSFPRQQQDHRMANVWRKRCRADGQIDWRMSSKSIHNLVRALARPYVGAHFLHNGNEVKVWKAEVVADVPTNMEPGKIVMLTTHGPTVKCGEQGIRLLLTDAGFIPTLGEYL